MSERTRLLDLIPHHLLDELGNSAPHGVTSGEVDYAILAIGGAHPAVVASRMSEVVDLCQRHGADVLDIVSGLVVITLNGLGHQADATALAHELQGKLGGDVRGVRRREVGLRGPFGSHSRVSWTFIAPGFENALRELLGLPGGELWDQAST